MTNTVARELYGRDIITTDVTDINRDNVVKVLKDAINKHIKNRADIVYLWDYYRGKQPILGRQKPIRPEINNKIVENRANEIVSFKVGYLCGEPIQYISRAGDEKISKGITYLNEMMFSENKASQDKEVIEWQMICGTAYRLVLPDRMEDVDDAPFEMYTLDPRDTFVVYSNEIGNKPMMAVKYCTDEYGNSTYSIYTENMFWKIKEDSIIVEEEHPLGIIPIFEYPANNARLGAFEIVLPMLDAINNVASNRMDGMEQFIQSFIKFVNCDISVEDFKALKDMGAIKVKSVDGNVADVDIISQELNQMQTQTLVDYLYQTVLTICGMPSVSNGNTSDSSNNGAVILKNGWQSAESRAKDSELMFKRAEQNMLKLVLRICRDSNGVPKELSSLKLKSIDLMFTRRNYENIQSKSQVLVSMLQQEKIHPKLAFAHSGMFTDAERAYTESMAYYEEQQEKVKVEQSKVKDKVEDSKVVLNDE